MKRILHLIPEIKESRIALHPNFFDKVHWLEPSGGLGIPIGMSSDIRIVRERVEAEMRSVGPGQFVGGHVPYSTEMASLLKSVGWKAVTILRDPRDIVVSHAEYQGKKANHYFSLLSPADRVSKSITGFDVAEPFPDRLLSIDDRYRRILGWGNIPLNRCTTFEKLVGCKGGGSDEQQKDELLNIAQHLGLSLEDSILDFIARKAHGKGSTFHRGIIGRWRSTFNHGHKQLFKRVAGSLLIELGYERDTDW